MKKYFLIFFFILLPQQTLSAETITIVADEWCPYNCKPDSKEEGYAVEIMRKIFRRKGISVKYKTLNWNRAVKEVSKGTFNAAIASSYSEGRGFIFPKETIGISSYGFYGKMGSSWKFKDIKSLNEHSLGVIDGYSYYEDIDNYISNNRNNSSKVQVISDVDALGLSIKKLAAGRITLFIEQAAVANYAIKKLGFTNKLTELDRAKYKFEPEKHNFYIGFSPANKNSKKYAQIFDDGIRDLRESGELTKILAKYNLADWKN